MRASRLLFILTTLQAKGRVTASAIAAECEVSLRTVYRDIDALSAAGIPVYSERGNAGGYRLLDGYRTRLNGLSAPEAEALFLLGLTQQVDQLGLGDIVARARNKLLAALPESMRAGAGTMRSRFHLDTPAWFDEAETLSELPRIADAVWNNRVIAFEYQGRKSAAARSVEPLGIVLKGGLWYLVANSAGLTKTYRMSRIGEVTMLDRSFETPPGFDLASYWSSSRERFETEHFVNRAVVRMSPDGMKLMEVFLPPFVVRTARITPTPEQDGWHVVELSSGPIHETVVEMLRFGLDVEVIEPPELRAQMRDMIEALALRYKR